MPVAPKKLPADSRAVRVFYISTDPRLRFIDEHSLVWSRTKQALEAYEKTRRSVVVSRGIGKRSADPFLFIAWAFSDDLAIEPPHRWKLRRGIPIDVRVDDDEMLALKTELAFGGD